jgi:hypothetical protein
MIREKIKPETPPELRKIGRAKEVAEVSEPLTCEYYGGGSDWTEVARGAGSYDTGLYETSRDFNGMTSTQRKKILEERKELKEFFESRFEEFKRSHPDATQNDFISSSNCVLYARNGQVINTSSLDDFLRLFLACRSNQIAPKCDERNPNYNGADFVIEELRENNEDETYTLRKKTQQANVWFANTYERDPELVRSYLMYVGAMAHGRKATEGVMLSLMDRWIGDREYGDKNLEYLLKVIEEVSEEEIMITNSISKAVRLRKIQKIDGKYVMDGRTVGRTQKDIYHNLMKKGNEDLLEMLLENE